MVKKSGSQITNRYGDDILYGILSDADSNFAYTPANIDRLKVNTTSANYLH